MDKAIRDFQKRQRAVEKKHQRLAEGYVTRLRANGTLEHIPARRKGYVPLRPLILLLAVALLFKGYLLAALGAEEYAARLAQLASGTTVEKLGSWLMAADPVTVSLSDLLQPLFS